MLKNFSVMKRKEGMSLEDFRKWALEEHVELGKVIPGMVQYRMNVSMNDNPDSPDAVSEMWWESMEARTAGFATEAGKAAGADAAAHCSSRMHIFVEEKIVL